MNIEAVKQNSTKTDNNELGNKTTDEATTNKVDTDETEESRQKMKDEIEQTVFGFERKQTKSFAELQMTCPIVSPMLRFNLYGETNDIDDKTLKQIIAEAPFHFVNEDGILCHYKINKDRTKTLCDIAETRIVPVCLRQEIMDLTHEFAHPGIGRNIKMILGAQYSWNTMYQDIRKKCLSCRSCILSKRGLYKGRSRITGLDRPKRPFDEFSIDTVPMPLSNDGNAHFLNIVDTFSSCVPKTYEGHQSGNHR
jgi:hypothetical protein